MVTGGLVFAGGVLRMQNKFSKEAELHWGSPTGWNDASDAFRHAYVGARFSQYLGEHIPNILGLMHEGIATSDDPRDSAMDVWNNKVGSEIGKKYLQEDDNASIAIAKEIKQAINSGLLITDFMTDPRVNNSKAKQKNNFNLTDNTHDFF